MSRFILRDSHDGEPQHSSARNAGVKDVAAAAGVSLGTVSNVLNRPDRVSEATRSRVERVMNELGFVRNESARQLRAGKSNTIAYVMLDGRNPFFADVAHGIERAAATHDLAVFVCNSDNDPLRERSYLARLEEQRVQGILITPVEPDHPALADVVRRGTPLVVVDRVAADDDHCSVSVDDDLGGRLAIQHLLDQGHRRIAFVGGPASLGQVADRLAGARAAWADAVLPADDLVVISTPALDVEAGREAGARILGLASSNRPTAAFCANDLVALGLLQQCVGLSARVPEDLAIVGYDDIDFAAAAAVPLTSVRQPRTDLGRRAADLLSDEATTPDHRHERIRFTPELVARASTRAHS